MFKLKFVLRLVFVAYSGRDSSSLDRKRHVGGHDGNTGRQPVGERPCCAGQRQSLPAWQQVRWQWYRTRIFQVKYESGPCPDGCTEQQTHHHHHHQWSTTTTTITVIIIIISIIIIIIIIVIVIIAIIIIIIADTRVAETAESEAEKGAKVTSRAASGARAAGRDQGRKNMIIETIII